MAPDDATPQRVIYVSASDGDDEHHGKNWHNAKATIQAAVDIAEAGDQVWVSPGIYVEAVTIARAQNGLTVIGIGARGSVEIAPSATNATALTNEADDFIITNVVCNGQGTGNGATNRGSRFHAKACKFTGGTIGLALSEGTAAQVTALTHGTGTDVLVEDCRISENTTGIQLIASDRGSMVGIAIRNCTFFANSAASMEESGGTASTRFRNLVVAGCVFGRLAAGTEPTAYILLNDDNANSGQFSGNYIPSAIAGGKCLVSTAVFWIGNFHVAGVAVAQPS